VNRKSKDPFLEPVLKVKGEKLNGGRVRRNRQQGAQTQLATSHE